MYNKKQNEKPLFAEVKPTGDEVRQQATIGKHCCIASNVVILKGVTIGDNCVIGAGCVVYKDVPEGSIIVNGNKHESK